MVGQDGAVTGLIIALLALGHVLLEGVPGVAKTLLVRSLSQALSLQTRRIHISCAAGGGLANSRVEQPGESGAMPKYSCYQVGSPIGPPKLS